MLDEPIPPYRPEVEAERKRIARVLHDDVGQLLTSVRLNLQRLRTAKGALRNRILDETEEILGYSLDSVRSLSHSLTPAILEEVGLVSAVRRLLRRQADGAGYEATFENRYRGPLPDRVANAAFEIIREALTNVARHAAATSVTVQFRRIDHALVVTIHDDGAGFDSAATTVGLGLTGMREACERIDGRFLLLTAPGAGTTVRAVLPLKAA